MENLMEDNEKLVNQFGAKLLIGLNVPDFYTFTNGLIYSHRNFDLFLQALRRGEKCAIVSGVNPSGNLHLGHKIVFDTNLYFQKTYGIPVFIPLSDDESYVTGKVKDQQEALTNAILLAKELLAYGYDPEKTYFLIDQFYTNIYNLAIKLSRKLKLSEIIATYGYKTEDNPGLIFYPAIQSAHITLPQEKYDIKNVLVIIGADEDSHIRICRDLAVRFGYAKPSILHVKFLPGLDGTKMSKSKGNGLFLKDTPETIHNKIMKAYSGGAQTKEEQKRTGGNPEKDIACQYLKAFFLTKSESETLFEKYKQGKILSKRVKELFSQKMSAFAIEFQNKISQIDTKTLNKCILKNEVLK